MTWHSSYVRMYIDVALDVREWKARDDGDSLLKLRREKTQHEKREMLKEGHWRWVQVADQKRTGW